MKDLELTTIPALPIKNAILFPGLAMPLAIGRPYSVKAVESALSGADMISPLTHALESSLDEAGITPVLRAPVTAASFEARKILAALPEDASAIIGFGGGKVIRNQAETVEQAPRKESKFG